eukprot:NODE_269_length_12236_cov_0.516932.p6 type:complete len:321 gc:universal NODE_269_length_12236_cov_0.516932:157-1119(+)
MPTMNNSVPLFRSYDNLLSFVIPLSFSQSFCISKHLMEASALGFGTYQLRGLTCSNAVKTAIETGYTLIDTATVYKNEEQVGQALKDLGTPRNNIFITSKLSPYDQGYDNCIKAVELSLNKLQLNVIDLYLIHWPGASKIEPSSEKNFKLRNESYKALEQSVNDKKLRYIGISNYTKAHLVQLLESCDIKPYLIQNECHPLYYDQELIDFCKENKILFQAYSSLGGSGNINLVDNFSDYYLGEHLESITKHYSKTLSQVLLKWAMQKGLLVIPKASSREHIEENFDMNFNLSDKEMSRIDKLKNTEFGSHKFSWDPTVIK